MKQCCGTDGVEANYIKTEILPPFFKHFWQHRMALDRRNYRQVGKHTEVHLILLKRLQAYAHIPLTFLNGLFLQQLVDTTVELANKVGAAEIISRIVDDLKDEAEQYRKMVMETIEKIMGNLGAADIDHKLEEQLIDGILYAFQEQTTEVSKGDHTGFITSCKKKKIYCVQFLSKSFQDGRNPLYKMFVLLT